VICGVLYFYSPIYILVASKSHYSKDEAMTLKYKDQRMFENVIDKFREKYVVVGFITCGTK